MDTVIVSTFSTADKIALLDIVITVIIAIWISIFVNNNFTTIRAVKEYFITEDQIIRDEYNEFLKKIYNNEGNPREIPEWFKVMTMKINVYEGFLKKEFHVHPKLGKHHTKIKILITGSDELNSSFNAETFSLLGTSKTSLHKIHKDFSNSQTRLVVEINKAKPKSWLTRQFKR